MLKNTTVSLIGPIEVTIDVNIKCSNNIVKYNYYNIFWSLDHSNYI